ncbi:MAG: UDP-N-acetylglucosamine 2-epimerase (non-hydrolyzing) [Candidatus Symbiothrix sp.]|jgi:UDP-GlcNAc3NAcA epimerase|nr:UDP-N-acetylglucosamine 2-epimerase (non-hydrolyzing) [Candidatus Symbiothrix sp.]
MKKIVTILGARPQFIKAATVSRQFQQLGIDERIVHTGQHFDQNMSEVFFEEMEIPHPAYQLNIHSLSHGAMTGRMLEAIEPILLTEKPDGVLVYGDTNSTLAGALAAAKLNIPVIHIEAGLRSFNNQMPEEINRILTDRLSQLLFCPTQTAVQNLQREGFEQFDVEIVKNGDVMQDAALFYAKKAAEKSTIIQRLGLKKFALATIHRQENTDSIDALTGIIEGLNAIHAQLPVLVPLHPRTRNIIAQHNMPVHFQTIEPVGYFDMIRLLQACEIVLTDSGGVQKEAFFFGKHCITLRQETEWIELVENGYNVLVGSNPEKMQHAFEQLLTKTSDFNINLYGNGHAAELAANSILAH